MIEIVPATKLKINTVVHESGDQLLVCVGCEGPTGFHH